MTDWYPDLLVHGVDVHDERWREGWEAAVAAHRCAPRELTPTCCARDALRAQIAYSEGQYVGGYHGDGMTAIKANAILESAVGRHPGHDLTQPDRYTGNGA